MDSNIHEWVKDQSEVELSGLPLGVRDGHDDVVSGGQVDHLALLSHVGQHGADQWYPSRRELERGSGRRIEGSGLNLTFDVDVPVSSFIAKEARKLRAER